MDKSDKNKISSHNSLEVLSSSCPYSKPVTNVRLRSQQQNLSQKCVVFHAELRRAFKLFDREGDGKINVSDYGTVLRSAGLNPSEKDIGDVTRGKRPRKLCDLVASKIPFS
jgi:hypothetical protein